MGATPMLRQSMERKAPYKPVFAVAYDNHCFCVYKKVLHLPSQLGIFVFTITVKRFHIYRALLHLALKVFTFAGPYNIFTFRGATPVHQLLYVTGLWQRNHFLKHTQTIKIIFLNNLIFVL